MAKLKALSQLAKTVSSSVTKARNKASAKAFEKAGGKKKAPLSHAAHDILSEGLHHAKKKHSAKDIAKARRQINKRFREYNRTNILDLDGYATGGKVSRRSKPRGVGIATHGYGRAAR